MPDPNLPTTHEANRSVGSGTFGIGILGAGVMGRKMMAALPRHPHLPFAVNFPVARGTASRRMREIVRGGDLGPLTSATIRLRFARWPRDWQVGASAWLAGPAEGGFTREVLSHFGFRALRLFGPATVADVELQREPDQAETALRARWLHRDLQVLVDAAAAGEIADDNRFEVQGERGRVEVVLEAPGLGSGRKDFEQKAATVGQRIRLVARLALSMVNGLSRSLVCLIFRHLAEAMAP